MTRPSWEEQGWKSLRSPTVPLRKGITGNSGVSPVGLQDFLKLFCSSSKSQMTSYRMSLLSSLQLGTITTIKKPTWAGFWNQNWGRTPAGCFGEREDYETLPVRPFLLLRGVRKAALIMPRADSLGRPISHLPSLLCSLTPSLRRLGRFWGHF